MARGTLVINARKQLRVQWSNSRGKAVEMAVPEAELSASLQQLRDDPKRINQLHSREVELDEEKGQPKHVRPVGESWQKPSGQHGGSASTTTQHGAAHQAGQPAPTHQPAGSSGPSAGGDFHNPYNFIPVLPRDHIQGDLGDREPLGHDRYHDEQLSGDGETRISGVLTVKLTVATPLLLPDAAAMTQNADDHKTFPVRLGPDGQPYLAPTSVKGMLRASYEAVTNSRLGVFAGHQRELAYRMATQEGLRLIPARVESGRLTLLTGTCNFSPSGPQGLMYAAWLPRYSRGQIDRKAVTYPNGVRPEHGDAVECWIELFQHQRWDRFRNGGRGAHVADFQLWRVRTIARQGEILGSQPAPSPDPGAQPRRSYYQPLGQWRRVAGYVCITNANIDRKHDERVFFTVSPTPPSIELQDRPHRAWETLIRNYQEEHQEEIRRGRSGPPALTHSVWSRHVTGGLSESRLDDGTLCYAAVEGDDKTWKLLGLYPVNISRKLHQCSPASLLPPTLQPAPERRDLSPADRVFGWVKQDGHGAYRGNLRIGPVLCLTTDAVESFGKTGLPLAILGQPKPQQARFYVAATPQGEAQPRGLSKEASGYREAKGLRGRKVYLHHAGVPPSYWSNPLEDRTQQARGSHFQEYRRPHKPAMEDSSDRGQHKQRPVMNADGTFRLLTDDANEQRDDQNRSVSGWVRSGTEFTCDLHVTNLSPVELGALLWLCTLDTGYCHRLGGGKPLGFGSVRLEITGCDLCDGKGWRTYYSSLDEQPFPAFDVQASIRAFQRAVVQAYGQAISGNDLGDRFQKVPFIAAFLKALAGFSDGLPVHYPRVRQTGQHNPVPPHPEGRAYEWFVVNDRTGRNPGPQCSLPDLSDDGGLPVLDTP